MNHPEEMTDLKARLEKLSETLAEAHGREYFARNDLPGPGSRHDQIYSAGFRACLEILWPCIEAAYEGFGNGAGRIQEAFSELERRLEREGK